MPITLTYPTGCAMVVGATGRLGPGIVRAMAQAGVPQVFTYRSNADAAVTLEAELRDAGHVATALQMDLTDVRSIEAALDQVEALYGPLHSIMVGAGVPVPFNRILDFEIADVERFFDGDAMGVYRLFNRAAPRLRRNGGGTFIPCTTMATRRVIKWDGMSPFAKGSIDALVRQVAAEEAEHNIRCNSVVIGWVQDCTLEEIRAAYTGTPPPGFPADQWTRIGELTDQIASLLKVPRPVSSLEAGLTYAWLASDQARHLTGQAIAVDHGILL